MFRPRSRWRRSAAACSILGQRNAEPSTCGRTTRAAVFAEARSCGGPRCSQTLLPAAALVGRAAGAAVTAGRGQVSIAPLGGRGRPAAFANVSELGVAAIVVPVAGGAN